MKYWVAIQRKGTKVIIDAKKGRRVPKHGVEVANQSELDACERVIGRIIAISGVKHREGK